MKKEQIIWDLSEMYPSTTDSSIQKDIDDLNNMAQSFARAYTVVVVR